MITDTNVPLEEGQAPVAGAAPGARASKSLFGKRHAQHEGLIALVVMSFFYVTISIPLTVISYCTTLLFYVAAPSIFGIYIDCQRNLSVS